MNHTFPVSHRGRERLMEGKEGKTAERDLWKEMREKQQRETYGRKGGKNRVFWGEFMEQNTVERTTVDRTRHQEWKKAKNDR